LERLPAPAGPVGRLFTRTALATALTAVRDADLPGEFDLTPYLLAERFVLREQMRAPGQWVGGDKDGGNPEAERVSVAGAVPWERERTRRLTGLGFESGTSHAAGLIRGRPGAAYLLARGQGLSDLADADHRLGVARRVLLLRVAVRL